MHDSNVPRLMALARTLLAPGRNMYVLYELMTSLSLLLPSRLNTEKTKLGMVTTSLVALSSNAKVREATEPACIVIFPNGPLQPLYSLEPLARAIVLVDVTTRSKLAPRISPTFLRRTRGGRA